jgi:hypothetical protein
VSLAPIALGDHLRQIVIGDRCTPTTDALNTGKIVLIGLLDTLKNGKIVPITIGDHLGQIVAVDNRYAPATDDRYANFSASTCPIQSLKLIASSERVQAATRKISSAA